MKRWYFWVLAPVLLGAAVLLPLLLLVGEASPNTKQLVIAFAISAWLVLATLGMADPIRFRWALIVDAAVLGLVILYANFIDKSPPPPPMSAELRRFRDIAGGVFAGIGLLFALIDTIGATLWALGPRDRNYSQVLIVPPIFYLIGGIIIFPAHPNWRSAVLALLFVGTTLAVQLGVPRLAELWANARPRAQE
jgi:bacteriorhodopsin